MIGGGGGNNASWGVPTPSHFFLHFPQPPLKPSQRSPTAMQPARLEGLLLAELCADLSGS